MTMQRTLKLYRLPEETKTAGFRPLEARDISQAYKLLNQVSDNIFSQFIILCPVNDERYLEHF